MTEAFLQNINHKYSATHIDENNVHLAMLRWCSINSNYTKRLFLILTYTVAYNPAPLFASKPQAILSIME